MITTLAFSMCKDSTMHSRELILIVTKLASIVPSAFIIQSAKLDHHACKQNKIKYRDHGFICKQTGGTSSGTN
jgi:hypothetical protein